MDRFSKPKDSPVQKYPRPYICQAEQVKKRDVFSKYGEQARLVLEALLDKYMDEGISELENLSVLKNDPFRRFGSPANIARLFGGKQGYLNAVNNLTQLIYNVA